jgi:3-dehydroquinate synthase
VVAQEEDRDLARGGAIVNDDLGYPVVIGDGLRRQIERFVRARGTETVVVCDDNPRVARVATAIAAGLRGENRGVLRVALGEARKSLATVERVLERLLAVGADRSTLVLGVGGGVAADVFGFAAATYMRGIAYAHVATSLVAMVDAAIGGKTGVNLRDGKNLAGAFKDPAAVFCDASTLATLPFRALREGLAEIVKVAIIEGDELFDALETLSPHPFGKWPWVALISAAVKVKSAIVADDRHDRGMRELLNLGHTFGHAIERASEYRVTHGAAVALGLRAAGLLAMRTGRFSEREHLRVLALLALLRLPLRSSVDPNAIVAAMRADKKRRHGRLRFVLPRAIGDVEYGVACNEATVRAVLSRLQNQPEALAR